MGIIARAIVERVFGDSLTWDEALDRTMSPPPLDVPGWNPRPQEWSSGHARNMAYRYRSEVAPMYRNRPTFQSWAERWDNQPRGGGPGGMCPCGRSDCPG